MGSPWTIRALVAFSALLTLGAAEWLTAVRKVADARPPEAPSLPQALLGGALRQRAAADVQWVRAAIYGGDARFHADGYPGLAELVHLVIALDPQFHEAYGNGAMLLASHPSGADEATRILEDGERRFPTDWHLPFYRGAVHMGAGDAHGARKAFAAAAAIPGCPSYVGSLAARLVAEEEDCWAALAGLREVAAAAPRQMRDVLMVRQQQAHAECIFRDVEAAARTYRDRHGAFPSDLNALVTEGLLEGTPPDPLGGRVELDAQGKARSSTGAKRLTPVQDPVRTRREPP